MLRRGLVAVARDGVSDECAASVQHDQPSLSSQLFLRPPDHVPAHAVLLRHLQLTWQPVVNSKDTRADIAHNIVVDLLPQQPWRAVADAVSLVWQRHTRS